MLTFRKRQGVAGASEVVQIKTTTDAGGYADLVDKYDGTEPLTCILWPGDDRAQTTTLPCEWSDGPLGRIQVDYPLETMSVLDVTWYSGMLKLADGSADLAAFRVEVTSGPGAALAPKTYHSYSDLTDELPFVAKLASYLEDQSGFAEVAAEARKWIDAEILRKAPVPYCDWRGYASSRNYGVWGGNGVYGALDYAEDPTIAAALDADQLVITTATGRRFVEASVYYTLAKILKRSVGMKTDNDLLALSTDYKRQAEDKLTSCVAEIDVNADGIPEYVIPLNRNRLRRS